MGDDIDTLLVIIPKRIEANIDAVRDKKKNLF